MDAISSLTAISPLAVPTATTAVVADRATTVDSGPQESVQTIFSDFARNLLAQQTSGITQGINDALSRNLLSPTLNYVAGGQLYTSAGLLQQYVTSQFLSQLESNQLSNQPGSADSGTTIEAPGFSFFGGNSSQSINSIIDAYQQMSLLGGLSLFGTGQTATNSAGSSDKLVVQPVVRAATSSSAATNTAIDTSA